LQEQPLKTLKEWLLTVPDNQGKITLSTSECNNHSRYQTPSYQNQLRIAYNWLAYSTAHIAQVLSPDNYVPVFTKRQVFERLIIDRPTWKPPPQPQNIIHEASQTGSVNRTQKLFLKMQKPSYCQLL
jgi:hypothetical protein